MTMLTATGLEEGWRAKRLPGFEQTPQEQNCGSSFERRNHSFASEPCT